MAYNRNAKLFVSKVTTANTRVGAKYIGTCTCLYLSKIPLVSMVYRKVIDVVFEVPKIINVLNATCIYLTKYVAYNRSAKLFVSKVTTANTRVGAKYIGTCTCLYLSNFFRVLACTLYLSFKNVLVLVPKYITKYLVLEDKYIASTSRFVPQKIYIIIYFFSFSVQYF